MGEDGIIATANHVVEDAETIDIVFSNLSSATATLLGRSLSHDLALISVDQKGLAPLPIAGSGEVSIGESVIKLGYSIGSDDGATVTSGLVSALPQNDRFDVNLIQTDAAVNPGDSGAPILNRNGEVLGIVSSKLVGAAVEGVGYAVDADHLTTEMSQMMAGETVCQRYPESLGGWSFRDSNFGYFLTIPQEAHWIWQSLDEFGNIFGLHQEVIPAGGALFASSGVLVLNGPVRGETGTLSALLEDSTQAFIETYDSIEILRVSTVCFPIKEVDLAKEVELNWVISGELYTARWLVFFAGAQGYLLHGFAWPDRWESEEKFIDSAMYSFTFENQ